MIDADLVIIGGGPAGIAAATEAAAYLEAVETHQDAVPVE